MKIAVKFVGSLIDGVAIAAGAMVFVVIEEVVSEAQRGGNTDFATFTAMLGFAIMMILDVAFS